MVSPVASSEQPSIPYSWRYGTVLTLFTSLIFINAFLLFWIEPLFSKTLLPVFGGSPSVWTTAVFFFQLLVLLGYLYAHLMDRYVGFTFQWLVQLLLLALAVAFSPRTVHPETVPSGDFHLGSILSLLWVMARHIGLPFFVVCTFSSLAQKWYARLGTFRSQDPYFLYTAGNLGSLGALLAFPFLLEPHLGSAPQLRIWSWGLMLIWFLVAILGWLRPPKSKEPSTDAPAAESLPIHPTPAWGERFRWVLWSFIPSAMMLAVTTLISVDLVSFPLLWIVPLALYLLSYIWAFSSRKRPTVKNLRTFFIVGAILALFIWVTDIERPLWLILVIYLLFQLAVSYYYHRRLYESRPSVSHLTLFYLCLAMGGLLGGGFNSLLAPTLFTTVLEFPVLVLVALVSLSEGLPEIRRFFTTGRQRYITLGLVVYTLSAALLSHLVSLQPYALLMLLGLGLPLLLSLSLEKSSTGLFLSILAVLAASALFASYWGKVELRRRNFFGSLSVVREADSGMVKLFHGTTQHGIERQDEGFAGVPLAYYHPSGPCGIIFKALYQQPGPRTVALIGLGIGSQLAYARKGDAWTIIEIDPDVIDIATDGRYFSYWRRCRAEKRIVPGDGRVQLAHEADHTLDLIIVDAFNSDAIPLHLLTREAFSLYLKKLKPDGLLALHVTNRNIDLLGQLQQLASALNLSAVSMVDTDDSLAGKFASHWVLFSSSNHISQKIVGPSAVTCWRIPSVSSPKPWSDDWNNLLSVIRWRQ